MPIISRFYGIIISMYFKDHAPPHFHAQYGEQRALIDIKTGKIIEGALSNRAIRLVREWAELHREELLENFTEAQKDRATLKKIAPLD